MSYMPDEVYYVFVNFKIGNYNASPLPPQHVQSVSLERFNGEGSCFAKGQIVLYDETALKVEHELAKAGLSNECEFSFGYVGPNAPKSPTFKMKVTDWTTQFKNDGSMTLNIEITSDAAPSYAKPKADTYENMKIEDIIKKIAKEEGWKVRADSIEPIQPVYENNPNVTSVTGPNDTSSKKLKTFVRSMQPAPQFIRQVLAPECKAQKDGESGYTLFFSDCDGKDVAEIEVPSDGGGDGGGFVGKVVDFLNKVSSFIGEFFSLGSEVNALQKLNGESVMTEKTDVGSIGGDIGAVLGVVSSTASKFGGGNSENYTDTPSTNATVYFRPRARSGKISSGNTNQKTEAAATVANASPTANQTQQAQAAGNSAWRAELTKGVDAEYCFEIGTGNTPRATVISFNPTYKGTILWGAGGESTQGNAVDANKNTLMQGTSAQDVLGVLSQAITQGTSRILQSSSASREELENMAAFLHKAAGQKHESATMEIFGDPNMQLTKTVSVLMLTKYGQPHHTSGKWLITGIKDTIQGGTYTTTLELKPDSGSNAGNGAAGTNKAGADGNGSGGATHAVAADASVQKAIDWAISIANDDSHGYSQASREGPDYDCSSFVYSAFEYAGFGVIENCTSWPGHPGNCETMPGDFKAAGFEMMPFDKDNLQVGDILWHEDHTEIFLGNNQRVGAHGCNGKAKPDQISVTDMYYTDWTHIFRYPVHTPNPQLQEQNPNPEGAKTFNASAYYPDGGGFRTAYGVSLEGKTINSHYMAVNPDTIPYGTVCYITFPEPYTHLSGKWVAVDTGGYFNNHPDAIDLMFGSGYVEENRRAATEFGRRDVLLSITNEKLSVAEAEHWRE